METKTISVLHFKNATHSEPAIDFFYECFLFTQSIFPKLTLSSDLQKKKFFSYLYCTEL